MKIRLGFVSNSSSSSYTCDICGNTESGYDQGPDELGFAECVERHTFCKDHLIDIPESPDTDLEDDEADEDGFDKDGFDKDGFDEEGKNEDYEYVASRCPICQFQEVSSHERKKYLYEVTKVTDKELDKEIKARFKNYKEFQDFIFGKETKGE